MWLKPTRPPTDPRAAYAQALAAPPSPRHVEWLRAHGYTGPILSQRHASELVNRLAAQLPPRSTGQAVGNVNAANIRAATLGGDDDHD